MGKDSTHSIVLSIYDDVTQHCIIYKNLVVFLDKIPWKHLFCNDSVEKATIQGQASLSFLTFRKRLSFG